MSPKSSRGNFASFRIAFFSFLLAQGIGTSAFGLMMETVGPLSADRLHAQPGWPHGMLDVMGHPSRVYSRDVNGNETVYFNGKIEQVAELIDMFSRMRCRDLVVHLEKPGSSGVKSMEGTSYLHNVRLNVTGGIVLGMKRLKAEEASTYEPVLTIYIDEPLADFMEVFDWPKNLIIRNNVPDLEVKGKREQPVREIWHTKVNFEDGKPAVDFESGLQTTVTLWEKGQRFGIDLGKVTHKGTLAVPFSKAELTRLKEGDLWMTTTVGNWLTKAKPTDTRLEIGKFHTDPALAKEAVAFKPAMYFGQILFEDGSPAVLDPTPWPGAELQVSFSYAGMVRPDKEGKFKVSFTKEQLEALKSKRDRKNIYIPSYEKKNRSTALHSFPVGKLSQDEAKPGVIKIPKPQPPADPEPPKSEEVVGS